MRQTDGCGKATHPGANHHHLVTVSRHGRIVDLRPLTVQYDLHCHVILI
jgi:hypothetical protein